MNGKRFLGIICTLCSVLKAVATDYYISPEGNDNANGLTAENAMATIGAAGKKVKAGDVVYIMPGTYIVRESDISKEESSGPYKIIFDMNQKGTADKPIRFIGLTDADGKRPVFDLSAVKPAGYRVTAFLVSGQYLVFRNFEVTGIQVTITGHTQSENFRITNGSHNTFDNIACHDGMGIGFYLTRNSSYNLFVNCDGYNNYDPISDISSKTGMGSGGNNDAFGCHVNKNNPGNIFIGCRAWNNSDDGYDLINCHSATVFAYSFAYKNGYDAENVSRGDGNGFKAGGYGMSGDKTLPEDGAPMHVVHHCIAVSNKSNGIYSNHHIGGIDFHDNTSYKNNRYNYSFVNRRGTAAEDAVDVDGYGHIIERNLSVGTKHVTSLNGADGQNTIEDNSFTWANNLWMNNNMTDTAFESTNITDLKAPREPDGTLSEKTLMFLRPKEFSVYGCDMDGYKEAVEKAKRTSGAEINTITGIENIANSNTVRTRQGQKYYLNGLKTNRNTGHRVFKNGYNGHVIIIR
ncbi:MAG: right-handed parallel beta-helix repeat-containing protein [Prevotella sp.]|mgnify:CR=1 FL=1|uniref:right-handed parallel beta-helix repeat-containing protein n=1 Tax=Prevotella sp. PTAC TaxID=2736295 RepID=UPI00155299E4|nr:right-handed parallel beta-helix repeat-containing protein [Prevotella sp. PTAC]MCX4292919.1 right-handed parallel beta-helix repeat-containing protein [Prevotella sp.]NPD54006.1 right-handed parallel beta-helix repeat-containing protein [Prevotella sp. PTAC]